MRSTRLRSSRSALLPILFLVAAVVFWPTVDSVQRNSASAQSVSWLGPDSTSYLTSSSGIPVWVPSWLPGPVAGTTPEIYAGNGSYSIYFYSGSSFLYITGVAGAGFPAGSEADLNVQLSVNASVAGYPAIQDLGIPAGSDTPIYDKVMWIAGGVLYTVNGNGLDSGSMALANSSVVLQAPAAPAPTDPPVYEEPVYEEPVYEEPPAETGDSAPVQEPSTSENTSTTEINAGSDSGTSNTQSTEVPGTTGVIDESVETPESAGRGDDGTGGPWYTGHGVSDLPSDGTAGPIPPRIAPGDGTGGAQ